MNSIRKAVLIILFAVLPAAATGLFHPNRPAWTRPVKGNEIELNTALQWGGRVLWVDARGLREYEKGHIPDAVLLNEEHWESQLDHFLDRWKRESRVVIYCSSVSCEASQGVAARLKNEAGISDVYVLKGGWETWRAAQKK